MAMSWRAKRQIGVIFIFLAVAAVVLAIFLYPILVKKPTCFDTKMNGTETGVDCGGTCMKFCSADIKQPVVLWSRSFKVTDGLYNAAAYVQNQNPTAGLRKINYELEKNQPE